MLRGGSTNEPIYPEMKHNYTYKIYLFLVFSKIPLPKSTDIDKTITILVKHKL